MVNSSDGCSGPVPFTIENHEEESLYWLIGQQYSERRTSETGAWFEDLKTKHAAAFFFFFGVSNSFFGILTRREWLQSILERKKAQIRALVVSVET